MSAVVPESVIQDWKTVAKGLTGQVALDAVNRLGAHINRQHDRIAALEAEVERLTGPASTLRLYIVKPEDGDYDDIGTALVRARDENEAARLAIAHVRWTRGSAATVEPVTEMGAAEVVDYHLWHG